MGRIPLPLCGLASTPLITPSSSLTKFAKAVLMQFATIALMYLHISLMHSTTSLIMTLHSGETCVVDDIGTNSLLLCGVGRPMFICPVCRPSLLRSSLTSMASIMLSSVGVAGPGPGNSLVGEAACSSCFALFPVSALLCDGFCVGPRFIAFFVSSSCLVV